MRTFIALLFINLTMSFAFTSLAHGQEVQIPPGGGVLRFRLDVEFIPNEPTTTTSSTSTSITTSSTSTTRTTTTSTSTTTSTTSTTTTSSTTSSTLPGNGVSLPARIQSEDFTSYYDKTPENEGGEYRDTPVDIERCTDVEGQFCFNVGWISKDEWQGYTVNNTEGLYDVHIRYSAMRDGVLRLRQDDVFRTPNIQLPATGDWQNWTTLVVEGVYLAGGTSELKLWAKSSYFNLNWFEVKYPQTASSTTTTTSLPGTTLPPGTRYALQTCKTSGQKLCQILDEHKNGYIFVNPAIVRFP